MTTVALAFAVLLAVSSPGRVGAPRVAERHPPPVRSTDMLRRAGGVLWWVTGDCRLYRLRMAAQAVDRAAGRFCRAWPAPDGGSVMAAPGEGPTMPPPGKLEVVDGHTLRATAVTGLPADLVIGPVGWSPDSLLAAVCVVHTPRTPETAVLTAPWTRATPVSDRCSPAFTESSTLLTSDGTSVFENGIALHLAGALARSVGSPARGYRITALTAIPGGLIAGVHIGHTTVAAGAGRSAVLIVDRVRGQREIIRLQRGVSELGAAPDGSSFWYRDAVRGGVVLMPLHRPPAPGLPRVARAFAWSPDGRYAAAALGRHVVVVDTRTGARGLVAAAGVRELDWTR
ncbi:MAG TPA: hypothetical protein VGC71_15740 [Gaiellales bacterium]